MRKDAGEPRKNPGMEEVQTPLRNNNNDDNNDRGGSKKKKQKHHCLTCGAVHGADPTFSCGSFFHFVFFLYLFRCLVPEPF